MNLANDIVGSIRKFLCKLHGVRADHNYSPSLHTLFTELPLDVKEQTVVNLLWTMLEELQNILEGSNVFPQRMRQWMDETRPTRDKDAQTDPYYEMVDQKFVQVTCDKAEMERRIAAFIKRKRCESDAFNQREFCRIYENEGAITCARTDAVYVARQSKKSLLKINRVVNSVQPRKPKDIRCERSNYWQPSHPSSSLPYHCAPPDLRMRVDAVSSVLSPKTFISENKDLYKHLKDLEERVLYLETLSPEYFQMTPRNDKKQTNGEGVTCSLSPTHEMLGVGEVSDNLTLIDIRIQELRERLRKKAGQIGTEN